MQLIYSSKATREVCWQHAQTKDIGHPYLDS